VICGQRHERVQCGRRPGRLPASGNCGHAEADRISELFDREESGRRPPYGLALDFGCGTSMQSVVLAWRRWQVTGLEIVAKALRAVHERARDAGVEVQLVQGDVAVLRAAGVRSGFRLVLDFRCFHGLDNAQRRSAAREATAITMPGAAMLMIVWASGRRGTLPRGASRADIEAALSDWTTTGEEDLAASALPPPLQNADPRVYRLHRD
jgi:SAM-dependent methyltransferase